MTDWRRPRRGGLRASGALLSPWQDEPVYHAPAAYDWMADVGVMVCGRTSRMFTDLPIRHLDRFARPCRQCWEVEA